MRRHALFAGLAAAALAVGGLAQGWLQDFENHTLQTRHGLRAPEPPPDIVVVGIDEESFSRLERRWPFPRRLHGRAIDRLRRAGARTIVYDVQFTDPGEPADDMALYESLGRTPGVILATAEVDARGRTNVLGGDGNLARVRARAGAVNMGPSHDGVIRRLPYAVSGLPSLAVRAAEHASGRPVTRVGFAGGEALIDWRGPPGTFRTRSFADVLDPRAELPEVKGAIVVVGATAATLHDVHATPTTTGGTLMSGPEVQANAIWTVLNGIPLRPTPLWLNALLATLLAFAAPLLRGRLSPAGMTAGVAALAVILLAGAQAAFLSGTVVAIVWPLVALLAGAIGTLAVTAVADFRARRDTEAHNAELERLVRLRTADLREAHLEAVQRLAQAAEARDAETGGHLERMSTVCHRLALAMGMTADEAEVLRNAALLHDVGKIGVPDHILRKPGPLVPEERAIMERHATDGAAMLAGSRSQLLQLAEEIALSHHERWDGEGYPRRLSGEHIPLPGRICAIADVFDALLSARPYKSGWTFDDVLAEFRTQRGRHFDPDLVDVFLEIAPELHRLLYADADADPDPGFVAGVVDVDLEAVVSPPSAGTSRPAWALPPGRGPA